MQVIEKTVTLLGELSTNYFIVDPSTGKKVRHRDNGPAILYESGYQSWWENGKLHRVGGPAVTYPDGYEGYWYYDTFIGCNDPSIKGDNKMSLEIVYGIKPNTPEEFTAFYEFCTEYSSHIHQTIGSREFTPAMALDGKSWLGFIMATSEPPELNGTVLHCVNLNKVGFSFTNEGIERAFPEAVSEARFLWAMLEQYAIMKNKPIPNPEYLFCLE